MDNTYTEYSYSDAEEPANENWHGISAIILKALKSAQASGRVCEIGCDNGAFSQALCQNGYDVIKQSFYGRAPFLWKSMIVIARAKAHK